MLDFKMNIPFFDASKQYLAQKEEIDLAIKKVLAEGKFVNGPEVEEFSFRLASYLKINHVIPCANGTDALCLALMALNLERGDEVIIPAFNFIAVAEAVVLLGLVPVFVDVCENNFNIDCSQIETRITSKTKAIVVVHLFGASAEMDRISEISKKHHLFVIEDVAQSLGSEYKNQKLGTFGHIGCTSFFPTKNLACFGDGGAVFTNDTSLAVKLKMIANHGQQKKYNHEVIGLNSRLDTLQAAVLKVNLNRLNQAIKTRKRIAETYYKNLVSIKSICLPKEKANTKHTFNQYCILVKSQSVRDSLQEFLQQAGVGTMIYYPKATHLQKAFDSYGYREGDFSVSEDLCSRILALPIFPVLEETEQFYIVKCVENFFRNAD